MKTKKLKKASIRLPTNFKERTVACELKLEKGIKDQNIIQELKSLYTVKYFILFTI